MIDKVCVWCGKPFSTPYPNQKSCSKECSYKENLRQKRQQWADAYVPKVLICKECGTEFKTECGDKHSVFCCLSCSERHERKHEHQTERHKAFMRTQKRKREKQLSAGFVEEVTYDAIYQRNKGICQVCGLPVHPLKGIDNNWDGTIDHIIPLSLGGKHSMANCQLAHRICNSLKGQVPDGFTLDWETKSAEDNYWNTKYQKYLELMSRTPA